MRGSTQYLLLESRSNRNIGEAGDAFIQVASEDGIIGFTTKAQAGDINRVRKTGNICLGTERDGVNKITEQLAMVLNSASLDCRESSLICCTTIGTSLVRSRKTYLESVLGPGERYPGGA